jgi:cytochrome c oxidase subunit 1
LEWTLPSPPGHGNFEVTPTVYNGPYEYSVPGMDQDFLPQNQPAPETARLAVH